MAAEGADCPGWWKLQPVLAEPGGGAPTGQASPVGAGI